MTKKMKLRKFNQVKRSNVGFVLTALAVVIVVAMVYINL